MLLLLTVADPIVKLINDMQSISAVTRVPSFIFVELTNRRLLITLVMITRVRFCRRRICSCNGIDHVVQLGLSQQQLRLSQQWLALSQLWQGPPLQKFDLRLSWYESYRMTYNGSRWVFGGTIQAGRCSCSTSCCSGLTCSCCCSTITVFFISIIVIVWPNLQSPWSSYS